MKRGIWEEFDGYKEIVSEIEAARKYREHVVPGKYETTPYIERLHPAKLNLRIADIIEESPSTKTFRLVSESHYLPPGLASHQVSFKPGSLLRRLH